MNKLEFKNILNKKLSSFPKKEVDERINFYLEIIDEYIEDGMSEEEAIKMIASTDEIVNEIVSDIPLVKIATEKIKIKRKLSGLEITLLIVGFPIWFSLLAAFIAFVIALYASLWSVVVSMWACFASLAATSVASVLLAIFYFITGQTSLAFGLISSMFVLLGLSILFYLLCKLLTKYTIILAKKIVFSIKMLFIKKGDSYEKIN